MVQLAYGADNDGEYTDVLGELDEMTRGVDKLINEQCKLDVTSFYYYDGIEQDLVNGLRGGRAAGAREDLAHRGDPRRELAVRSVLGIYAQRR